MTRDSGVKSNLQQVLYLSGDETKHPTVQHEKMAESSSSGGAPVELAAPASRSYGP